MGFEPTGHLCPLVFKTSSIGRSDNPPETHALRHPLESASSLVDSANPSFFPQRLAEPWEARLPHLCEALDHRRCALS